MFQDIWEPPHLPVGSVLRRTWGWAGLCFTPDHIQNTSGLMGFEQGPLKPSRETSKYPRFHTVLSYKTLPRAAGEAGQVHGRGISCSVWSNSTCLCWAWMEFGKVFWKRWPPHTSGVYIHAKSHGAWSCSFAGCSCWSGDLPLCLLISAVLYWRHHGEPIPAEWGSSSLVPAGIVQLCGKGLHGMMPC